MATDDLATEGVRTSHAVVLTYLCCRLDNEYPSFSISRFKFIIFKEKLKIYVYNLKRATENQFEFCYVSFA